VHEVSQRTTKVLMSKAGGVSPWIPVISELDRTVSAVDPECYPFIKWPGQKGSFTRKEKNDPGHM